MTALTPKVVPTRGQVREMLAGAPDPRTKALVAILASDVGTHWEVHNARARFNRLANGHPRRGLPPICPGATPHSLRHCAATILLEEGVPMRVVADLLGHSSTRVTEDVYAHVSTRLSAQAATVLNQAL